MAVRSATTVGTTPANVDLKVYQGDDVYFRLTVTDPAGNPVDLGSVVPRAQVRRHPSDEDVVAEFVCAMSASNVVDFHLPSAQSIAVDAACVWDLQVTTAPGGLVTTLAYGAVIPIVEVTR